MPAVRSQTGILLLLQVSGDKQSLVAGMRGQRTTHFHDVGHMIGCGFAEIGQGVTPWVVLLFHQHVEVPILGEQTDRLPVGKASGRRRGAFRRASQAGGSTKNPRSRRPGSLPLRIRLAIHVGADRVADQYAAVSPNLPMGASCFHAPQSAAAGSDSSCQSSLFPLPAPDRGSPGQ